MVLDSGAIFTYLPTASVNAIYKLLGAVISPISSSFVFVDCALLTTSNLPITVAFQFTSSTGPVITVPLDELVFPLADYAAIANHISALGTLPFKDTCMLGLLASAATGGASVLGDTFLRSAYVVYDLESNSVGIAQTVFNATGSNVVEFAAGQSGFPVVSGIAVSSSVTATGTGGAKTTNRGTTGIAPTQSTSKAAFGRATPPPFEKGLLMVCVVGLFWLLGAGWFLG